VQLLSALGLDTGFRDLTSCVYANCNAGMELDLRDPAAPYVVKSPFLCDYLDEALEAGDIVIDHALVPVRDLFAAAESRRDVTRRADRAEFPQDVPGGLWYTTNPDQQEQILQNQLYKLIFTLAKRDIPVSLLHFPRIVHDPVYLYGKLAFALDGISYEIFQKVFLRVSQPQLVHDFKPVAEISDQPGTPMGRPPATEPARQPRPATEQVRRDPPAESAIRGNVTWGERIARGLGWRRVQSGT
jgi:hypothetical protein